MPIATTKVLRMVFDTAGGNSFTLTMPEPRENVTLAEIEAAMDMIITKDLFNTKGGSLTAKRDIRIVDTVTNDLYDPPSA